MNYINEKFQVFLRLWSIIIWASQMELSTTTNSFFFLVDTITTLLIDIILHKKFPAVEWIFFSLFLFSFSLFLICSVVLCNWTHLKLKAIIWMVTCLRQWKCHRSFNSMVCNFNGYFFKMLNAEPTLSASFCTQAKCALRPRCTCGCACAHNFSRQQPNQSSTNPHPAFISLFLNDNKSDRIVVVAAISDSLLSMLSAEIFPSMVCFFSMEFFFFRFRTLSHFFFTEAHTWYSIGTVDTKTSFQLSIEMLFLFGRVSTLRLTYYDSIMLCIIILSFNAP